MVLRVPIRQASKIGDKWFGFDQKTRNGDSGPDRGQFRSTVLTMTLRLWTTYQ